MLVWPDVMQRRVSEFFFSGLFFGNVQLELVDCKFLGGWNYLGRHSANDVELRFVIMMEEDSQQVCCLGIAEFFEMHGGLKNLWTYFDQSEERNASHQVSD